MIALFFQIALFVALIEVALWCVPREVRRASQANCLRPNGTRSPTRTRLERQAYHRLRFELVAPLFLIFLMGNALFQTIDKTLAPVPSLLSSLAQPIGLASATDSPAASVNASVWMRVATLTLLWLISSMFIAIWRLIVARRNFAEGVRTRSSEYAQFDVTRTSAEVGQSAQSEQNKLRKPPTKTA